MVHDLMDARSADDQAATSPSPLILLAGPRRSGTTLLAGILSSDPRTNPLGQEAQILTQIVQAYRWGRLNFERFGLSYFDNCEQYRIFFHQTVARFAQDVSSRASPGGVLVLKSPEFSLVINDVADLFPEALLLAMVRDPRDQVASELAVAARRRSAKLPDKHFGNRNVLALSQRYMAYMREITALSRQQPARITVIRYEDLVLRPNSVLADLRSITGLELPFDPAQQWMRVSPLAALHEGPDHSDLYGFPIDSSSVGRFQREMMTEEVAAVENSCAEIMLQYGYSTSVAQPNR